jgi:hypothetical protein
MIANRASVEAEIKRAMKEFDAQDKKAQGKG